MNWNYLRNYHGIIRTGVVSDIRTIVVSILRTGVVSDIRTIVVSILRTGVVSDIRTIVVSILRTGVVSDIRTIVVSILRTGVVSDIRTIVVSILKTGVVSVHKRILQQLYGKSVELPGCFVLSVIVEQHGVAIQVQGYIVEASAAADVTLDRTAKSLQF